MAESTPTLTHEAHDPPRPCLASGIVSHFGV